MEDSTIDVKATENAIDEVLHAKDPIAAYHKAAKSGQISIDGKSLKANAKISAVLGIGSVINSFVGSLI